MIRIDRVNKYYNKGKANQIHAIDNTSLTLPDKGIFCFLGPSGCGKTTLLNAAGGLDKVNSGTITINDQVITRASSDKIDDIRNAHIGYIFQNFNLIPKMSAQENVELPLIYRGVPRAERQARVAEALERVGLSRRAKHLPTELSGGQQQRVAIARALVTRPSLILGDEPTGNLDSHTTAEIMDMFHALHEQGNTIVLITHDNDVAKTAKRVIHILDGKLSEVTL